MTNDELNAIKARAAAATPGEWVNMGDGSFFGDIRTAETFTLIAEMPELDDRTADFDFIAHARADVPALVEEVRRLRAFCQRLAQEAEGHPAFEQAQLAEAA